MPTDATQRDLKALQELVQAQPAIKQPLIWLELRHVEREQLLCESVQDLVRVELVGSVRSVLSTAFSLALLFLIYSKLTQLAQWLDQARTITVPLPPPISRSAVIDLSGYIPSSTALDVLSGLPQVSWDAAWKWLALIVGIIALEKAISGYQAWRRGQALRQTAEQLAEEAKALKALLEKR